MKVINPNYVDAETFVVAWLNAHEAAPVEHNEDWAHFVSIVADCAEAYAKSVLQVQIALQEQSNETIEKLTNKNDK